MTDSEKERRARPERRSGADRRSERASVATERRSGTDRRAGIDRRLAAHSAADQIHAALALVTRAVEARVLPDEERWMLDTAMLRLRFALERLEEDSPPS
ncbi:MAG: hypothetical protein ACREL9_05955 [Gemmatimonadales bacterium]